MRRRLECGERFLNVIVIQRQRQIIQAGFNLFEKSRLVGYCFISLFQLFVIGFLNWHGCVPRLPRSDHAMRSTIDCDYMTSQAFVGSFDFM